MEKNLVRHRITKNGTKNAPDNKSEPNNISITKEYTTVSSLNAEIKQIIECPYKDIKVSGELSNYKISGNNMYATLKDCDSAVNIIVWSFVNRNTQQNMIDLSNGDNITVYGKITLYQKTGNYNITAHKIERTGVGNLYQEYETKKQYYESQGYYNNKKKFPASINKIGIVTAKDGAALQDILHVLKKNSFFGSIYIKNCLVQGTTAAQSITNAINCLSNLNTMLDLIIISRGGGSFEDLLAFSSDDVIEAIHTSKIFTISAVGHEIDFMLSDFVADLRAATPSVAAEIVSTAQKSKINDYIKYKYFAKNQIWPILSNQILTYYAKLAKLDGLLTNKSPIARIENYKLMLDKKRLIINKIMNTHITSLKDKLTITTQVLQKYDIENMLQSGYTVLLKNNRIVDSIAEIKNGQKLKLKMKDGEATVIIDSINNDNLQDC